MKHLGDITKLKGSEVPLVDIVTGGSPCQDLSVAGKREGLAGERSGLFMEQIRLIKEMRESDRANGRTDIDIRPRYMVWENVPGAFSSNKGEDFRCVLEETAKVADNNAIIPRLATGKDGKQKWSKSGCIMGDGWSIAWRLHDAQFWGVPQRRKRIALVADFGGTTAPEILFERKGVSGDIEESGETGEGAAADVRSGVEETGRAISFQERAGKPGGGKGILIQNERTGALSTLNNQSVCAFEPGAASRVGGHVYEDDVAGTVRANAGDNQQAVVTVEQQIEDFVSGVNAEAKHQQDLIQSDLGVARTLAPGTHASGSHLTKTLVTSSINARDNQQAVVYSIGSYDSGGMKSDNPHSGIYEADTSRTLDNNGGSPACNQGGMVIVQGADVYNGQLTGETAATLTSACGGSNTSGAKVCYRKKEHPQNAEQGRRTPTVVVDMGGVKSQCGVTENVTPTLATTHGGEPVVLENHPNDSRVKIREDGTVQTLSSRMDTGGGNVPMVMEQPTCLTRRFSDVNIYENGITPTLEAGAGEGGNNMPMVMQAIGEYKQSEAASSLKKRDYKDATDLVVSYGLYRASFNQGKNAKYGFSIDEEKVGPGAVCSYQNVTGTLCSRISAGTSNQLANDDMFVANTSVVRRLTPLECERLQGFPDGWTDIGEWVDTKGKKHKDADSPRYKALGNSIALPFWEWMAHKMAKYIDGHQPTMASLFDGIGGFPLVFSRAGVKPIWASEIEEFPIAVTKIRFKEKVET